MRSTAGPWLIFLMLASCGSTLPPPGSEGAECGGDAGVCNTGLHCIAGFCTACGGADQSCCTGPVACDAPMICAGSDRRCVACGGAGQACCNGGTCGAGLGCSASTQQCAPCGANGQVCCESGCGDGVACNSSSGVCETCGGRGQLCCAGAMCSGSATCTATDASTDRRCL